MTTKQRVYEILSKHPGKYFSGEQLASDLKITRASIWKAIKTLQNEGYSIKAVTNKGYCYEEEIDFLTEKGIKKYLHSKVELDVRSVVTSTNTLTVEQAVKGKEEGYIMIAGMQTNGRGRTGHTFFSPRQTGIYMSILLRPNHLSPMEATNITSMAAVSACEAIEKMGENPQIKWINDIFINGKKTCGILTEAAISMETKLMDYVVMGIGFNVYEPEGGFPNEIKNIAGAILDERIQDGRNKLVAYFINSFMHYYHEWDKKAYHQAYKDRSMVLGKEIYIDTPEGLKKVFAKDIDENFELVIIDQGIEKTVSSGEVHIKL